LGGNSRQFRVEAWTFQKGQHGILPTVSENPAHRQSPPPMGAVRDHLPRNLRRLQQRQEVVMRMVEKKVDLVPPLLQPHRQRCNLPLRPAGAQTVNEAEDFHKESEGGRRRVKGEKAEN
jgi:hypothetical protein